MIRFTFQRTTEVNDIPFSHESNQIDFVTHTWILMKQNDGIFKLLTKNYMIQTS
jgi:hypothetical protein